MSGFLMYKSLSREQVAELESSCDAESVKSLLGSYLGVSYEDERKVRIALDFHFYNFAFAKEQAFDARQTSTFISLMHAVMQRDHKSNNNNNNNSSSSNSSSDESSNNSNATMSTSYAYFQQVLLKHCVERPPQSVQVFDSRQAEAILDYAMDSYFRHFKLYKYVFGTTTRLELRQVLPNEVEEPVSTSSLLPLDEAVEILPLASGAAGGEGEGGGGGGGSE